MKKTPKKLIENIEDTTKSQDSTVPELQPIYTMAEIDPEESIISQDSTESELQTIYTVTEIDPEESIISQDSTEPELQTIYKVTDTDTEEPIIEIPELVTIKLKPEDAKFQEYSVLPLRNTVLLPGTTMPITASREQSIRLICDAFLQKEKLIAVISQINPESDNPNVDDVYKYGTIAQVLRMIRLPGGSISAILQGKFRFKIKEFIQIEPYFKATIIPQPDLDDTSEQTKALMLTLKNGCSRLIELAPHILKDQSFSLLSINQLSHMAYFVASNLNLEVAEKQKILELNDTHEKANIVLQFLANELKILDISEEIQTKVKVDLDKQQRDYILRQQIKTIQDELNDQSFDSEIEQFKERSKSKKWPDKIQEVFDKELNKLYRLQNGAPEYGITLTYIEWLLDIPWNEFTKDRFDLKLARKYLDEDHYGMDKVKERILEYLAVLKLKSNMKAPILCFYGPPGVGKTSLAKSIARAISRNVIRISLGGVRDEAEIRGHRRTYIGAQPGKIIQNLKKAKTNNPIFILDEIDKVGNDWRGDPSSALLEVLDPEQNNAFSDHYLEVDYDLSSVMFIATANSLDTIHPALRDRMEIVEINGYTLQEKLQIAKGHLLPRQKLEHGLKENQIIISDDVLLAIIEGYTRESGVRKLTQKIANICRCVAKDVVENKIKSVEITPEVVEKYLGISHFENDLYQKQEIPGVVIGLAWTQVGGDILFIEAVLMRGSGKLTLTGQLGDVMKESATVAFMYLKTNADIYGIPSEAFTHWDVHIHVPAGAIPKDGPSAGITLLTAIASLFTQRIVKPNLAMTGEITLRGKTLPVGGIKEKVLAAARAGIHTVMLSKENEKDIKDIPEELRDSINFKFVTTMDEVISYALEKKTYKDNSFLKDIQKDEKSSKDSKSSKSKNEIKDEEKKKSKKSKNIHPIQPFQH